MYYPAVQNWPKTGALSVIGFTIGCDARSRSASGRVGIVVTRSAFWTANFPSSSAAAIVHVFCAEEVAHVAATRFKTVMHALVVGFPELRLDDCGLTKRVAK